MWFIFRNIFPWTSPKLDWFYTHLIALDITSIVWFSQNHLTIMIHQPGIYCLFPNNLHHRCHIISLIVHSITNNAFFPYHFTSHMMGIISVLLQWRHNGCEGVSNHQPHDFLLNRLFRRRSKKTSTLRVTCLCAGNSPVTMFYKVFPCPEAGEYIRWP